MQSRARPSPFQQKATFFQDLVIRCVRFAFAKLPAKVGRVFFSKWVAWPFFRWRLLRHGYLRLPFEVHELDRKGVRGVYVQHDREGEVDVCVYYLHGKLGCFGGGVGVGVASGCLEEEIADFVDVEKVAVFRWDRRISISSTWWLGPLH